MTSAFIIQVDSQLQPDSGGETAALLRVLIYEINKSAFGNNVPTLPQWAGPPLMKVQVQAILFASLATSLLSAFLAMLGKQWLNRYVSTDMRGSAVERSHNRQRKLDGIIAWYFDHVMESLPLMLQAGLLLLGCALSQYLWGISITIASVVAGATSIGLIFCIFVIVAGTVSESCPYQTPGSRVLRYLGPQVRNLIRSVYQTITSTLRNTFEQSQVIAIVAENAEICHPWWSTEEIIPFFGVIAREVPRGLAVDVYHFGRAAIRVLCTPLVGVYRFVRGTGSQFFPTFKQRFCQQTTPSNFRCISWTLQTSLVKPIHLTALQHLVTMTVLAGLDPTLVADCFNVFVGCVSFSDGKLEIMEGLEQLATVSASCFFRTFHHLWVIDPTSAVLADLRRRYNRVIPFWTDLSGLPSCHTIVMTHALVHERWSRCHELQWGGYRPSDQEYIQFAQHMIEISRAKYQRRQRASHQGDMLMNIRVPRWILRFALHSLSLDPPPPTSVVADCLTIVAIDLDCDVPNIVASDERYV